MSVKADADHAGSLERDLYGMVPGPERKKDMNHFMSFSCEPSTGVEPATSALPMLRSTY